jgi:hypothetical protein
MDSVDYQREAASVAEGGPGVHWHTTVRLGSKVKARE